MTSRLGRLGRPGLAGGLSLFFAVAIAASAAFAPSADATDIDVNTSFDMTADDSLCTLREAVNAANTNTPQGPGGPGADCPAGQVTLDRVLLDPGTTYTLMGPAGEQVNAGGDLDVNGSGPISIEGSGSPAPTIDPNDVDRAIDARDPTAGDTLSVDGVRITDGTAPAFGGGAVSVNEQTVNLSDSSLIGNVAGNAPGGGDGGAIAISNGGTLNMSSSLLLLNQAISPNTGVSGGGIQVNSGSSAAIDGSVIASNSVISAANLPASGGGISSLGSVVLRDSTVVLNSATSPTGLAGGGGVRTGGGSAFTAVNATISSNSLDSGSVLPAEGSGIDVSGDIPVDLIHTTLADNTAADPNDLGSAIHVSDNDGVGTDFDVRGSALTGPAATNVCAFTMSSGLTSEDHNVERGTSCGLTDPNDAQDPSFTIGFINNNNGPEVGAPGFTQTLRTNAITAGSLAFDRVPAAACTDQLGASLTMDARGSERPSPVGGDCDTGAFELLVPPPGGGGTPGPGGGTGGGAPVVQVPDCRGRPATVAGNDGDDTLTGTLGPDVIVALGGSDTVRGLGGDDLVCGGDGRDGIKGGPGNDTLLGEGGKDRLLGNAGRDRLVGAKGKDICNGGAGKDRKPKGCERRRSLP